MFEDPAVDPFLLIETGELSHKLLVNSKKAKNVPE